MASERSAGAGSTRRTRRAVARIAADARALDIGARTPWAAARYAFGTAVALAGGLWVGGPTVGLAAASGAVNAATIGLATGLTRPRGVMWVATLALAATAFLGSVTAPSVLLSEVALAAVATAAGLTSTRGVAAHYIGVQALVGIVTLGHFPSAMGPTALLCLAVVAGGAVEVAIGIAARSGSVRHWGGRVPGLRHILIDPGPRSGRPPHLLRRLGEALVHPDGRARRHTVRLVACVVAADVVGRLLPESRGYWIVLTVVVVLKPDWPATASRGLARWAGTVVGAVLGALLVAATGVPHGWGLVVLVTAATWVMLAVENVNYGIFCAALTLWVVVFLLVTQPAVTTSAGVRALDTTAGGVLCLVTHLLTRHRDGS